MRYEAISTEGHPSNEHLVEDHPQRVQVATWSHGFAPRLLWREVAYTAQDKTCFGCSGGLSGTGYAKVSYLYGSCGVEAIPCKEDVMGLDVPVDNAAAVRFRQCQGDLGCYSSGLKGI